MCTPTQGVWQPAGCVSCELVCVCVSFVRVVIICPASTHTALVSSPSLAVLHLSTYLVLDGYPLAALGSEDWCVFHVRTCPDGSLLEGIPRQHTPHSMLHRLLPTRTCDAAEAIPSASEHMLHAGVSTDEVACEAMSWCRYPMQSSGPYCTS